MKLRILFSICVCLFLCLTVSAHPGRTDGNGGHTNHSTGEYHYHHGYSEHNHYDMDGDGDLDCPYDFNDKTGENSGYNSNSGLSSKNNASTPKEPEVKKVPSWIYWVIGAFAGAVVIMAFIIRRKRKEIDCLKQQLEREQLQMKEGVTLFHNALVERYGDDYLYIMSGAPDGDYVDDDLLPHTPVFSANPVYDRYTFFLGGSPYNYSTKYHHHSCRYSNSSFTINAYSLRNNRVYQACRLCTPSAKIPNLAWVDKYRSFCNFLQKYVEISHQRGGRPESSDSSDDAVRVNWRR